MPSIARPIWLVQRMCNGILPKITYRKRTSQKIFGKKFHGPVPMYSSSIKLPYYYFFHFLNKSKKKRSEWMPLEMVLSRKL